MRHMRVAVAALCGTVTLLAAAALPASAAGSPTPGAAVTRTSPMHVVGYDEAVAKAHGYRLVRDSSGTVVDSVPVNSAVPNVVASRSGITPDSVMDGNCGSSWMWITPQSGLHQAYVSTGFDVILPVDDYWWPTDYFDNYGSSHKLWEGGATGNERNFGFLYTAGGPATIDGFVAPGAFVVLVNGIECYGEAPWDSATVK